MFCHSLRFMVRFLFYSGYLELQLVYLLNIR
uniref:Uncharacterized protein n=1 Tax=Anguilla anguilla TaxID=7936 RepID=A0A0E9S852_ANGAN